MAKFSTDGLAEFSLSLQELAETSNEALDEMLSAEADVIEEAQRQKARAYGVYGTGGMIASITRGKVRRLPDGRALSVYPQGSRRRGNTTTREAEIGFINEFGKMNQPARPFVRDANEGAMDEAVQAAADVYDNYLKSKNL